MSLVTLQNISKRFHNASAVHDVSLEIGSGEFFSLLGPSGCGKTTLLRMIAGFEEPTSGTIVVNGVDVTTRPAEERGVGMVFQNYALFPHMTVFENVAFGLETRKIAADEVRRRVEAILESVHLEHKRDTAVPQLSGGEQQRVAVARALVVEPAVLLMDEPLSNLDVALRLRTREEIRTLQKRTGITTIYVTHDQSEAMSLSDRMAVMRQGRIEQIGSPAEMYETPQSPFVAEFLGGANVVPVHLTVRRRTLVAGRFIVAVPRTMLAGLKDGDVTLIVKPEAVILAPSLRGSKNVGRIIVKEYLGFTTNFLVEIDGVSLRSTTMSNAATKRLQIGQTVAVSIDWSGSLLLPRA